MTAVYLWGDNNFGNSGGLHNILNVMNCPLKIGIKNTLLPTTTRFPSSHSEKLNRQTLINSCQSDG